MGKKTKNVGARRVASKGGNQLSRVKKKHTWKSVREKKQQRGEGDGSRNDVTASKGASKPGKKLGGVSLRDRMVKRLSVARFRHLNERVDSGDSKPLASSYSEYSAYHDGFRAASQSWEVNPLDLVIEWVKTNVPGTQVVADFGCGDARLGREIPHTTHSFDLHAGNESVTVCDMRSTPLPDSSVGVVVFCLSLMGEDVGEFVREGARVLKHQGVLIIAEVESRVGNGFVGQVCANGFKMIKEQRVGVFCLYWFRKVRECKGSRSVMLKPSVYKKR